MTFLPTITKSLDFVQFLKKETSGDTPRCLVNHGAVGSCWREIGGKKIHIQVESMPPTRPRPLNGSTDPVAGTGRKLFFFNFQFSHQSISLTRINKKFKKKNTKKNIFSAKLEKKTQIAMVHREKKSHFGVSIQMKELHIL